MFTYYLKLFKTTQCKKDTIEDLKYAFRLVYEIKIIKYNYQSLRDLFYFYFCLFKRVS